MKIPNYPIKRLFRYRSIVEKFQKLGYRKIFSADIAEVAGVSSDQVRKDFSIFGITGQKRGGYDVEDLLLNLTNLLGKDRRQDVILVGAGNIGRALANYDSFEKENIRIVAAFDTDPMKLKEAAGVGVPVFAAGALEEYLSEHPVKIAIIAVPYFAAQQAADDLVRFGIKGILNFAAVNLKVPDDVHVSSIDVARALEIIGYYVNIKEKVRKV